MRSHLPRVNLAGTAYLDADQALDSRTFLRAMSFHAPEGLAAVRDESGAYHIDPLGVPAYAQRYLETFGFYEGVATVRDEQGFFHIEPTGEPLSVERYKWAGNYQEGLCAAQDSVGFLHLGSGGRPAYDGRFAYVGDFKHGVAVAHTPVGAMHIRPDGTRVHDQVFKSAAPYHKGVAVAEDEDGFYHVDEHGRAVHEHRFREAEPFYNGHALCIDQAGRRIRLRENGYYTHLPTTEADIGLEGLHARLKEGWRVGLLMRHAERYPRGDAWGNDVLLTPNGVHQARRLGERLAGPHPLDVYASPIQRCIQTARAAAEGARRNIEPRTDKLLGDPGPFADPRPEATPGVGPNEFGDFATCYIEEGRATGMRPLEVACGDLLDGLLARMNGGLTLFASHDLFVAGLLGYLGLKHPTRHDWADYLEAVCLSIAPDGQVEWRRFLGLEAIA